MNAKAPYGYMCLFPPLAREADDIRGRGEGLAAHAPHSFFNLPTSFYCLLSMLLVQPFWEELSKLPN